MATTVVTASKPLKQLSVTSGEYGFRLTNLPEFSTPAEAPSGAVLTQDVSFLGYQGQALGSSVKMPIAWPSHGLSNGSLDATVRCSDHKHQPPRVSIGYSSLAPDVVCEVLQTVGLALHSVVRSRPGVDSEAERPGTIHPLPAG